MGVRNSKKNDHLSEEDRKIIRNAKRNTLIVLASILVLVVLSISFGVYHFFYSMNALPKGELVKTVESPDHLHEINIYLANGGATTDYTVRGEVEDLNSKDKWNIYWNYKETDSTAYWVNNSVVEINNHRLNIYKDKYDFRHN